MNNTKPLTPQQLLSDEEKSVLFKLIIQELRQIRHKRGPDSQEITWSEIDKKWFDHLSNIKDKLFPEGTYILKD